MQKFIENNQKTLFIINSQYHELFYQYLLKQTSFLANTTLKDIKHFTQELLQHNNIKFSDETTLIRKLKLHTKLIAQHSDLANSINYLNELTKLENEFNNSNVAMVEPYQEILETNPIDLQDLKNPYNQIIILDNQDFMPLHHELISNLDNVVDYIDDNPLFKSPTQAQVFEHDNYTHMIDGVIQAIIENKHFKNTLIMVDNPTLKALITNYLKQLDLAYTDMAKQSKIENDYLQSLFNYLNQDVKPYDALNIAHLFKNNFDPKITQQLAHNKIVKDNSELGQLFQKLDELILLEYDKYISTLYHLLMGIGLYDNQKQITKINDLFRELALFGKDNEGIEINKQILNNLLAKELIVQDEMNVNNDIVVAGSDFNALRFKHVYIVDAAFPDLKASQTSTLLSTEQRLAISDKLINNLYLNKQYDEKLQKISQAGLNIYYHYSLVNFANKSLALKPFIQAQQLPIMTPDKYVHYTTKNTLELEAFPSLIKVDPHKVIVSLTHEEKLNLSASALNSFNSCQYQYYIKYVIKPRFLEQFDNMFAGEFLHAILESLNKLVIANDNNYNFLTNEIIHKTIDEHFELNRKRLANEFFVSDNLITLFKKQVTKIILRHLNNMQVFQQYSKYQIASSEQKLTYDYPNPYLDNVCIMGKIDALFNHENFYYVLDYKSSFKDFKINDFNAGNENQLMMYLYLLHKHAYQLTGAFFVRVADKYRDTKDYGDEDFIDDKEKLAGILLNDDLIAFDENYESEIQGAITNLKNDGAQETYKNGKVNDVQNVLEGFKQLETSYNMMIEQISLGEFKINPLNEKACQYCEFASLCQQRIYDEDNGEEDNVNE